MGVVDKDLWKGLVVIGFLEYFVVYGCIYVGIDFCEVGVFLFE